MNAIAILVVALVLIVAIANIWYRQATQCLRATARFVLGFRHHEIDLDGMRVVYIEKGRGTTLVLLHGIGVDKDNFLITGWRLARHHRVIIPDIPGFGDSDRPDGVSYSVDAQVERLHRFAGLLGLRQFALGGNSMGGFIAGVFAAQHPSMVSNLWLLAPAGIKNAQDSELVRAMQSGESPPIFAQSESEMRDLLNFAMTKPPYMPRFVVRALAADQAERYEHHVRIAEELLAGKGLDERLMAEPLEIPTLVVWGKNDRALHVSGADVLSGLLQNHDVQLLDQTGHAPHIEAPFVVCRRYLAFCS